MGCLGQNLHSGLRLTMRSTHSDVAIPLERLFALVQEACYVLIRCPAQRDHRKSSLKINSWPLRNYTGITLHHVPHLEASTTMSHLYVWGISLIHSRSLIALTQSRSREGTSYCDCLMHSSSICQRRVHLLHTR